MYCIVYFVAVLVTVVSVTIVVEAIYNCDIIP